MEICVEGGCPMWRTRLIVPKALQPAVLKSLHEAHPGISQMKAIASSYYWWNGLDQDIDALGKTCEQCLAVKHSPPAAPLHFWVWPDAPWKCVHIDFTGPFFGHMFLLVVDTHSKWPEVIIMPSTTSP